MATPYTAPLAFVDEYGQANLDTTLPDVGSHFILTAVLVEADVVDSVRASVDAVRAKYFQTGELRSKRLAGNLSRFRQVLEALDEIPFKFYAVVVDKRELQATSGLAHKGSFIKFLSGLLYKKLFGAFRDLQVTADSFGRHAFMEGFARYLDENHRQTLFDRPRVTFVDSKHEPLVQLADVVCGVLARAYDSTKTTEQSAELLGLIRGKHAVVIDEWPVRYRAASGTGALLAGDPADDEVARYCIARSEEFLERHESSVEPETRAQVLALKKLLFEVRFGDPHSYVTTAAIMQTLEALAESRTDQWLRSTVIAKLRDAGVLVASSPRGYKIPVSIADIGDFISIADTIVHPMLNRVARARDAVLMITQGRVDVLGGEKLALLRAAVEAIPSGTR